MSAPWLSVVMPVCNGARTLERTLASLPSAASGIEVILVDQQSQDDSLAIARRHQDRLGLRIIPAPDTRNWMQNTNIGIRAATAPLIGMLHQDDLWETGRAEAMRAFVGRHPLARLWVHDSWFIDLNDRRIGSFAPPFAQRESVVPGPEALCRLLVQNTFAVPSVIFRRSDALATGGLDESLWYTADWDFWLRLAGKGDVAYLPRALASFRLHPGSQTVRGSRDADDFRRQLELPVERHIAALPAPARARVQMRAEASNQLNLCLAAAYHRQTSGWGRLALQVMRLGPAEWARFLKDTRIVARSLPRLRLIGTRQTEQA
jgi:glycosyltransferase involved in cell wall biosynthesis